MKKLILICFAVLAFTTASKAQVATMTNPNGLVLDTASQAAAEGAKAKVVNAKKMDIIVVTTKISGTIAGTISWQCSNDGVNYATISTTALTDASTNYLYKEVDKVAPYYKALITQTGTSSLSYKATVSTAP